MPKLRAIDFNKIKNGNVAEAKRVVKDLLMLTPRGPKQKFKATDYFKFQGRPGKEAILKTHEDWVTAVNMGQVYPETFIYGVGARKSDWWGYTDEDLYWVAKALGASGTWLGESAFRNILIRNFQDDYDKWGAKLTRSARRLHARMSNAWQLAIKGGKLGDLAFSCTVSTPGVKGSDRYYGPTTECSLEVSFACRTEGEAAMMLQTMMGHAVGRTDVGFKAWQAAEPAEILQKNVEQVQRLGQARQKAMRQMAELQEFISHLDTLEEAVQMYSMSICE